MNKLVFLGGEDVSARIEISKKFMAFGYKIEIIGTQNEAIFIKNNIPYKKYTLNREFNIFNDLKTIFELRKILKKLDKETIVHAFDTKPTLYLPIAALGLSNIKVVRTITGMGRIFTEENIKNTILKLIYNVVQKAVNYRVDFTVFQNDDDYNYFIKHNLVKIDKTKVIKSSGLDIEKFITSLNKDLNSLKESLKIRDKTTFILVSRMVKQKGILYYLEAAKLCHENGYDFNFLLVGQLDTDKSITLNEIEEYSPYVTYLGRREDVKELLQISDIFVLPTYYREGVPRVLLEASALGLPLITTNMPGCKDVVIENYNGKLVKIKNSEDLYKAMITLANEDTSLYSLNAKEKVKEFDLNKIVNQYNDVYKKIGDK